MKRKILILILVFSVGIFGMASASYSWLSQAVTSAKRNHAEPHQNMAQQVQDAHRKIQLALLLDTSNSMDGLIDQAKSELWKIVNALSKARKDSMPAELEIALYEYGNDRLSANDGYIRQVAAFTTDLDLISEKLFALRTNGGSEYCGHVIRTSLSELSWEDGNEGLKMIFIAGNEPFTQGSVSYAEQCKNALGRNIYVNTIHCGSREEGISTQWQHGALLAEGKYFHIDQDQKVVYIETPYDDRITALNSALNSTYIYYGSQGSTLKERQSTQDKNAAKHSKGNEVMRIKSKSSMYYSNAHWDLVDAYNDKPDVILEVDIQTLPDSLRQLSREQLKVKVIQYNNEREKIRKQIADLAVERDTWIAAQRQGSEATTEATLGASILQALRDQSARRGFEGV